LTGSASTAPDGAPFGSLTAAPRSAAQVLCVDFGRKRGKNKCLTRCHDNRNTRPTLRSAPDGEYRKVPGNFDLGINETIGMSMVESIKGGRPLSSAFEAQLPIIE